MIQRYKKLLFQPYPIDDNIVRKLATILLIGGFVVVFILIFNLNEEITDYKTLITLGFGLITIIVLTINKIIIPLVLPKYFIQNSWTVLKEILLTLLNISGIGFVILLYANWGGYYEITIKTIFHSIFTSSMIGVFPITFTILIKQNILLKKYLNGADELNKYLLTEEFDTINNIVLEEQKTTLYSENRKDSLKVRLENIHLIKSVENYVEIYWTIGENIQRTLLRSSLKRINEKFDKQQNLLRCHRKYIVNIDKIISVKGNSQGYKLLINNYDDLIPVSRTYSKYFRTNILSKRNLLPKLN